MASFTPATVTVCGVAQLLVVNVRLAGETVPSVVSLELRADRHVGRGLGIQHDGESGRSAGLGRH